MSPFISLKIFKNMGQTWNTAFPKWLPLLITKPRWKLFSHWLLLKQALWLVSVSNFKQFPKSNFFQELHILPHDKRWENKSLWAFGQRIPWNRRFRSGCEPSQSRKGPGRLPFQVIWGAWSDLWAFGKKWAKSNHLKAGLPKVSIHLFHGQNEDQFRIFWALLVDFG